MGDRLGRHRLLRAVRVLCGVVLVAGLGAGCFGPREAQEPPPDEQFGHRYQEEGPDGRSTIVIAPPDTAKTYFYYPAVFDTVHVRPAPFGEVAPGATPETDVEILVKGSFPDACTQLHEARQTRSGHIIEVALRMRKPQGAVCAAVRRPYRFYLMLRGSYTPGNYTLLINGEEFPFEVRVPDEQAR
jgi:hypothetical protein